MPFQGYRANCAVAQLRSSSDIPGHVLFTAQHDPLNLPNYAALMWGAGVRGSLGASKPAVWAIKNVAAPVHRWIYRRTGGRVLYRNILLLTTHGRKTGKPHTTPVFFLRSSERLVVCNVKPGAERTNPWVLNLRANPTATVQIGAEFMICDAQELHGPELDLYWPQLVAIWPAYREHYKCSGERAIFVLEPRR